MKVNRSEIKSEAHRLVAKNRDYRFGQAVMVVAETKHPHESLELIDSGFDCFYDNGKVEEFLNKLELLVDKE